MVSRVSVRCMVGGLAATLSCWACGEDTASLGSPAVGSDAGLADSGLLVDVQPADSVLPDGVASLCIGNTLAPFALDDEYCVAASYTLVREPAALTMAGDQLYTFAAQADDAASFSLQAQRVVDATSLSEPVPVFEFALEGIEGGVFASQYVAISASGLAAVGYNNADFANPRGEVIFGRATGGLERLSANGNFAVSFLPEETLVVNGLALGELSGQGVYARTADGRQQLLIDELGDNSGPLMVTEDLVLAGGFFPDTPGAFSGQTRIYAFARGEVAAALAGQVTLHASQDGDLVASGSFVGVQMVGDELVLAHYDESFNFDGIDRRRLIRSGAAVSAGQTLPVLGPDDGSARLAALIDAGQGRLGLLYVDAAEAVRLVLLTSKASGVAGAS